jgi:hypothetical protein
MADSILNLVDDGDPNESLSATPAAETEDYQDMDAKDEAPPPEEKAAPSKEAEPPKEKEPEKPQARKIKWQGKEIEVPDDEMVSLAQQGYDYTRKTQALSDKERMLAPLEGLFKQVQTDPNLAKHIASYFQAGQAQPQQQRVPDDPVEALKHEIIQQAKQELQKEMQAQVAPMQRQQVIQQVMMEVSRDPDYSEVQGEIKSWIQSMPEPLAKTVYLQLDQDPDAYLKTYAAKKAEMKARKSTTTDPARTEPPVKKVERAPVLESSGNSTPSDTAGESKRKDVERKRKKALQTGDPTALADWLVSSGSIASILE